MDSKRKSDTVAEPKVHSGNPPLSRENSDKLSEGVILGNRYKVSKEIGKSRIGRIYRATDIEQQRDVSLTLLPAKLAENERAIALIKKETERVSQIQHRDIEQVYGFSSYNEWKCIVREYISGATLRKALDEINKKNLFINLKQVELILSRLAEALKYAHEYAAHKNISPDNVYILKGGVKLADFGYATLFLPQKSGAPDKLLRYVAPEFVEDRSQGDARADVYCLGVLLFEILMGDLSLFDSWPNPQLQELFGPELSHILQRSLHKEPRQRYDDIRQMAADFRVALTRPAIKEFERERANRLKKLRGSKPAGDTPAVGTSEKKLSEKDRLVALDEEITDRLNNLFRPSQDGSAELPALDIAQVETVKAYRPSEKKWGQPAESSRFYETGSNRNSVDETDEETRIYQPPNQSGTGFEAEEQTRIYRAGSQPGPSFETEEQTRIYRPGSKPSPDLESEEQTRIYRPNSKARPVKAEPAADEADEDLLSSEEQTKIYRLGAEKRPTPGHDESSYSPRRRIDAGLEEEKMRSAPLPQFGRQETPLPLYSSEKKSAAGPAAKELKNKTPRWYFVVIGVLLVALLLAGGYIFLKKPRPPSPLEELGAPATLTPLPSSGQPVLPESGQPVKNSEPPAGGAGENPPPASNSGQGSPEVPPGVPASPVDPASNNSSPAAEPNPSPTPLPGDSKNTQLPLNGADRPTQPEIAEKQPETPAGDVSAESASAEEKSDSANPEPKDEKIVSPNTTNRVESNNDANIRQYTQRADKYYKQKRFFKPSDKCAVYYYKKVLQLEPNHEHSRRRLAKIEKMACQQGRQSYQTQQYAQAKIDLEQCLQLNSDNPEAQKMLQATQARLAETRANPPPTPEAEATPAKSNIQLNKETIFAVFDNNKAGIQFCIKRGGNVEVHGKQIVVKFVINPDGAVEGDPEIQSSTMNNKIVEDCILTRIKRWHFPNPSENVPVIFPFIFE